MRRAGRVDEGAREIRADFQIVHAIGAEKLRGAVRRFHGEPLPRTVDVAVGAHSTTAAPFGGHEPVPYLQRDGLVVVGDYREVLPGKSELRDVLVGAVGDERVRPRRSALRISVDAAAVFRGQPVAVVGSKSHRFTNA